MPTFANDSSGNAPKYYLSITLSSNAGSGFQQLITLNSSNYTSYEAANLSNINFQDGANNILTSWLESGETNTSTSTNYWVKLPNGTITVLYAVFYATTAVSKDATVTGAEPKYTATYGQYDNGANIFTFYDAFKGTTLGASWSQYLTTGATAGTTTVNNGLDLNGGSGNWWGYKNTATAANGSFVEAYAEQKGTGTNAYAPGIGTFTGEIAFMREPDTPARWGIAASTSGQPGTDSDGGSSALNTFYVMNLHIGATAQDFGVNYAGAFITHTDTVTASNIVVFAYQANGDSYFQWVRVRTYIATMPTITLGSITALSSSGAGYF